MALRRFSVTGMSCAACSARIEKVVSALDGVDSCTVSLLTNSMTVEGSAADSDIVAAVKNAGYGASPEGKSRGGGSASDAASALEDTETPKLIRRLIWSAVFLCVLMYISMGHMMWSWPLPSVLSHNHVAMGLCQMLLCIAVMIINSRFFVSGFKALWHRAPNMDTLVALGAGAAFVYSTCVLFAMTGAQTAGDSEAVMKYMHEFYYESCAMILTLITVGKMLEAHSKGKTTGALKSLMELSPKTATVIRDGEETVIPASEIRIGDIFVLRPGDSIPADGKVLEGSGCVDESSLTGESVPVDKAPGDGVSAGCINSSGMLKCRADKVGEDTAISQIIKMVSDATATKAPIAKVADKVSGVFVPTVMAIALVTAVVWLLCGESIGFALARAISVLVISCPCALGLATPVAIMVGSGVGAKHGILFKTAASLEAAGKSGAVVLDKTGTVTRGEPAVCDIICCGERSEAELMSLAASLENGSEHPLAAAIMKYAAENGVETIETEDFTALPGFGVTATVGGKAAFGGKAALAKEHADVPDSITAEADRLSGDGKTPLYFGTDGELYGIVAVADIIKDESPEAVRELKNMGLRVVMLTGDSERCARAVGRQAGIDEVIAEVLPQDKAREVAAIEAECPTAMVGDGVNDAPALTGATTGIAIGRGTDVAIDAADGVLVNSKLTDVPAAIRLSRATLRNIHENLFWAFFYNTIGIPVAAGVFIKLWGWQLNPMLGAAAMSLSSFCVVTNALRLNFVKLYSAKHDRKRKIKSKKTARKACGTESEDCTVMNTANEKTVKIEGMMCSHCSGRVKAALEELPGVESAEVSHEKGTATLKLSGDVSDDSIREAVEKAGYKVV